MRRQPLFSTKKNDNINVSQCVPGNGSGNESPNEAELFSIPIEEAALEELCPQNR